MSNKHLSNFNIRVDDNNNIGSGNLTLTMEGMDSSMQVTGSPRILSNNTEMKHLNLG